MNLESLSKKLVQTVSVHIILHILPSSYQSFIRGLDTIDKIPSIHIVDITTKLLQEEQWVEKEREASSDGSHALVSNKRSIQYTKKSNDKPVQF